MVFVEPPIPSACINQKRLCLFTCPNPYGFKRVNEKIYFSLSAQPGLHVMRREISFSATN